MADDAGLDKDKPELSADGVHSGLDGQERVASTECLFAETVVQQTNKLSLTSVQQYCKDVAAHKATTFEQQLTSDNEATKHMDEAIIHIVRWDKGQPNGTWYQYKRWEGKTSSGVLIPLTGTERVLSPPDHLLAKGGVGFLAIHLNIDDSCEISYNIESAHTRPLNQQDVVDLISLAKSYYGKGKAGKAGTLEVPTETGIGVWGGQLILTVAQLPANITFTPSIKKGGAVRGEAPANKDWDVKNTCTTKDAEALPKGGSQAKGQPVFLPVEYADGTNLGVEKGAQRAEENSGRSKNTAAKPNNSEDNAKSQAPVDPLAGAKLTIPDEGLHWWDVSVALPVTSYNKLTFSSENSLVTVKNTNDIKPYALFNAYLRPSDLRMKNGI
jgi:hypothetical protein